MTSTPDPMAALRERMLGISLSRLSPATPSCMVDALIIARLMTSFCAEGDVDFDLIDIADISWGVGRGTSRDPASPTPRAPEATGAVQPEHADRPLGAEAQTHGGDGLTPTQDSAPAGMASVLASEPVPEIDGGVEGHAAKTAAGTGAGRPPVNSIELRDGARSEGPAGVEPGPSIPTSEPDAAVAAGDDVLSAPGQALTAPPVDCTAAAPGTRGTPFPKLWTDEREAEFDALWHSGMDPGDIAAHLRAKHDLNFTGAAVSAHATKRGITRSEDRKKARRERNAEAQRTRADRPGAVGPTLDLTQIRIEYESGDPPIEIARRHGRSDGRIHQLAKANGWQRHAALRPTDTPKGGARPNSGPKRHVEEAPRADPAPFEPLPRAAAAPAPANDRASVPPAPDAKNWPLARRAIVTAGWKAGKSAADIAAEATQHGFRTLPGQVLAAVAQLQLTNDPDRRRAMHGGDGT